LNAANPFDEDGWFNTHDMVEEFDGGYIKFLGRKSEIMNIGGNKVFASYIENILLGMDEIEDIIIEEVNHPVLGNYVKAKVKLIDSDIKEIDFKRKLLFLKAVQTWYKINIESTKTEVSPVWTY
jgi:long-chain acyl-CoA synthetase